MTKELIEKKFWLTPQLSNYRAKQIMKPRMSMLTFYLKNQFYTLIIKLRIPLYSKTMSRIVLSRQQKNSISACRYINALRVILLTSVQQRKAGSVNLLIQTVYHAPIGIRRVLSKYDLIDLQTFSQTLNRMLSQKSQKTKFQLEANFLKENNCKVEEQVLFGRFTTFKKVF